MPDGISFLALVAGYGFVLIVVARLGVGSPTILGGIFPSRGVRDWPSGVQEADAPRFAVDHLDALRPGAGLPSTEDGDAPTEIVDLYDRRLAPRPTVRLARPDRRSAGRRGLSFR